MSKVIHHPYRPIIEFSLFYESKDEPGTGYSFPCDEDGNVDEGKLSDAARANLKEVTAHPDRFRLHLCEEQHDGTPAPEVVCDCGERFSLCGGDYADAFCCPKCGRWYDEHGYRIHGFVEN